MDINGYSITTTLLKVKEKDGRAVRSPSDASVILNDIRDLAQEAFVVLTLNPKGHLISKHLITLGLIDASLVHPREVFRVAIMDGASAILVAHNHPSGDVSPSQEDVCITKQLSEAGKIIGIQVMDHVIVGGQSAIYSFKENQYGALAA